MIELELPGRPGRAGSVCGGTGIPPLVWDEKGSNRGRWAWALAQLSEMQARAASKIFINLFLKTLNNGDFFCR